MSQDSTSRVMLPSCAIRIIIGRVAIDEAVDNEAVERESPILRRRVISMVSKEVSAYDFTRSGGTGHTPILPSNLVS